MKAVVFREHGGPEVWHYEEIDDPTPGPGEALVRVRTVTVNRGLDARVRGSGFGFAGFTLPHVSGSDPAGDVVALGRGVTEVAVGDRVIAYPVLNCGECDFCRRGSSDSRSASSARSDSRSASSARADSASSASSARGENYCRRFRIIGVHTWGGFADYVRLPAAKLVVLPDNVAYESASALPISYLPAMHGLLTLARLGPDDTLLVMAAGSGIGMAAIDLARMVGARVIATAGPEWKLRRAREIGADIAVSYADPEWVSQVRDLTDGRGASVVFDNVGAETWPQSLSLADRGARIVCSGTTGTAEVTLNLLELYRNMTTCYFHMQGTSTELRTLVAAVAQGRLHPVIDSRFPLADIVAADQRLARRENFGKVVLTP